MIPRILFSDKEYDLIEVAPSSILVPEERFASTHDDSTLRNLAVTLNDLPMINEVGVVQRNGKLVLIYGAARLSVLQASGVDRVKAKLWRVDPDTALYMQLAENAARGSYDRSKLLKYVVQLSSSKKLKSKQVAQLLGVDKSGLSKLKTIVGFSDELQKTFVERSVPLDVMYELRLVSTDAARRDVLNLILLANYSKDAARHYIRHIHVLLCDSCGKTARERNSYVALTLEGGEWLCTECLPQTGTPASPGAQPEERFPKQGVLGGDVTGTNQVPTTCSNCDKEYQHTLNERVVCDQCMGRMNALQAWAITKLGALYWETYPERLHDELERLPR